MIGLDGDVHMESFSEVFHHFCQNFLRPKIEEYEKTDAL